MYRVVIGFKKGFYKKSCFPFLFLFYSFLLGACLLVEHRYLCEVGVGRKATKLPEAETQGEWELARCTKAEGVPVRRTPGWGSLKPLEQCVGGTRAGRWNQKRGGGAGVARRKCEEDGGQSWLRNPECHSQPDSSIFSFSKK